MFEGLGDVAKNIGGAFKTGYSPLHPGNSMRIGSVGGFLSSSLGMGAVGASIGATAGAAFAATSSMDPTTGALAGGVVGGVAGMAALPAAGLAFRAAEEVADVGVSAIKNIASSPATFGETAASVGAGIGKVAGGAGIAALGAGATLAADVINVGSHMFKYKGAPTTLGPITDQTMLGKITKTGGVRLSALGTGLMFGSALLTGEAKAWNKFNQIHMGTQDSYVTRPTPNIPYLDNAGATGDLVFALNKNRRG